MNKFCELILIFRQRIQCITDERMAGRLAVDSYLVGPSGNEPEFEERTAGISFDHLIMSHRRCSVC